MNNGAHIFGGILLHPETTILTVTKRAANDINFAIIHHLFEHEQPLTCHLLDNGIGICSIYSGLRVMITKNCDKSKGIVNGQCGIVKKIHNHTLFIELPNKQLVAIYRMTTHDSKILYPIAPAYALTICKCQGQTLMKCLVYMDTDKMERATTYVALSRVKTSTNMKFITPLTSNHFL